MSDSALRYHQVGLEATAGTPVPATRKIYGTGGFDIEVNQSPVEVDGSYDRRRGTSQGVRAVKGNFECPIDVRQMPEILRMAIDGDGAGVQQAATAAYLWTFTPDNVLKTATWEWHDGYQAWEADYTLVDEMVISGNVAEGAASVALSMIAQDKLPTTMTAALGDFDITPFQGWEAAMYIDAFGGTAGTTQLDGSLIDYEVTLRNNLFPNYRGDNVQVAASLGRGGREIDAKFTFEANAASDAERTNWLANTQRLIRLELGNNTVIEDANLEYLTLDIPCAWEAYTIDESDGTTIFEANCHSIYDATNGWQFLATLMSDRVT